MPLLRSKSMTLSPETSMWTWVPMVNSVLPNTTPVSRKSPTRTLMVDSITWAADPELDETPPHYEIELRHPVLGKFDYHVDAYTGGFNLQIAWSTGYLAGSSV